MSKLSVTAVAKGLLGAVLAAAEIDRLCLRGFELHWCEVGALVTAVAEGLLCAASARTPKVRIRSFVNAGVKIDHITPR